MDFHVASTYDNMSLPINAPMLHQQPESHHFANQYPIHNTSVHTHHNLMDFYQLPQQQQEQQPIAYLEDQLARPLPTPSAESTKDTKKKPKRKQVKNACVNCQKACKKCDDGRACQRCIKLGLTATCVDSPRKERRKGIKRGPYKKRQPRAEQEHHQQQQTQLMLHTEWYDNMEYRGLSSTSSPSSSLSSWSQQPQQQFVAQQESFGTNNFLEQPCYPTNDMVSFVPSNSIPYHSASSDDGFGHSPSISSSTSLSPCSPATPPPPAANTLLPIVPSQQPYTQQIALLQKQQQAMKQQQAIEQQIILSMQQQKQQQQQQLFAKQQQEQKFLQMQQFNMGIPSTAMTEPWQFFL
ncbi:hypothetical protein BJV82DRAFT_589944 [Fennellomyces sp. T-0311]|nr:hypothetical protein BJV82DRAFT_589944 [Fennellomyces sp. T-0311]